MTIYDVLNMIGGLCLFLFGMTVMGDGLERTSDHCSNIAVSIIDAHGHNMNAHQSLRSMKEGNPTFFEKLDDYSRKYELPQA
jgi:phosphate:Na+ symporter